MALFLRQSCFIKFQVALSRSFFKTFIIILLGFFVFMVQPHYMIDKTKALEDKALYGYAFRNLTMKTVDECFLACYEDCFCMTFQMFNSTECQLLSSNQFQSPASMITAREYSYYDMLPILQQVGSENPANSCNAESSCQIYSNLCKHGAGYTLNMRSDYASPRFKCNCSPGYSGNLCEDVVKSCRGYNDGSRVPGKYKMFDENMNLFEVFCDFDLNSTAAWTLVQSHQLKQTVHSRKRLIYDYPQQENTPNWDLYRLSKSRMLSIQKYSSKWRITCKYDTDGIVYRDYLQATNDQVDIIHFNSKVKCPLVEWIDIRGQSCKHCTAFLTDGGGALHSDSIAMKKAGCQFQPTGGLQCSGDGEDTFGLYICANPAHRCSASSSATTQTWFGGD